VAPEFHPVATRRTFEEAVEQIAERITLGELRPGDQLPSERLLAQLMQISRPTVREAIRVLADSGVVEVRTGARGGAFVTSEYVPREVWRRQSDLRFAEIGGVLEARRLLEPQVAQLAARSASRADFEVMARTIEGQRRLAEQAGGELLEHEDRFLALDLQFHLGIASATQNTTIVSLVRSLLRRLEIARDMAVHEPPVFDWSIDIHERTLSAIRSGNTQDIDTVMDEHLAQLEEVWEREGGRPVARLPIGKVN
jgi:GntR family transcriptional regulator, transcriptional repressor for pyruvate dehydrogenase complex